MNDEERLARIREIYELAFNETESFEETYGDGNDPIGAGVLYLVGAIARDAQVDLGDTDSLLYFLRKHYPDKTHWVWTYAAQ